MGCLESEPGYVLNGLDFGFPLGVNPAGPFPPPRLWVESHVSLAGRLRIKDYLSSERSVDRIYGPLPVPRDCTGATQLFTQCVIL